MPTLAELLKEARNRAGLNQSQAAEKSGVTQGNISAYESGKTNPTMSQVQKLCDAYETTVSKLTKGLE
jgi:uncharacterized protein